MSHRSPSPRLLLATACLVLSACASHSREMMQTVSPQVARDLTIAAADGAVVVFMRPAERGGDGEATVFDITAGNNNLVGIVAPDVKVAYRVASGQRLFMVVGDHHADFMRADLAAGKTYHVTVESHGLAGVARISLVPVRAAELGREEFAGRNGQCRMQMPDEAAYLWAESNDEKIMSMRTASWPRWEARSADAKADATLRRGDGV